MVTDGEPTVVTAYEVPRRASSESRLVNEGVRFSPQQATMPLLLMPQLRRSPAATWMNSPVGGAAWPNALSPQHASVPSSFTPHVWSVPALISIKRSVGGADWPAELLPQQVSVRSEEHTSELQ